MYWAIGALAIWILLLLTVLVVEFRHPSKSVAWLLVLFIFPILGFVMYYFMAQEFRHKRMIGGRERGQAEGGTGRKRGFLGRGTGFTKKKLWLSGTFPSL
ncbi:PLDc N-terminal domain-containing protein [Paenibacillus sp. CC-CFT747]|nr:PLDc N-terminal domain-containing protein [Paenibacillus sp. CC-CFT747]